MGETFEETVERYLSSFRAWCPALSFSRLLITESPRAHLENLPDPVPVEDFGARFEEIIALGTRGWLNLTALGVDQANLILAVEYLPDGERRYARSDVNTNFSGMRRGVV